MSDATEIIVKDGVRSIEAAAYKEFTSLTKVTIPSSVRVIKCAAFYGCASLRFVQLPANLERIEDHAFQNCSLLEAIYLPPTVTHIGNHAFDGCKSLRIINIPDSVMFVGDFVISPACHGLLSDEIIGEGISHDEQLPWLQYRYNELHNLCWDPSVSPQNIQHYIQFNSKYQARDKTSDKPQFTPLHLLAANPSVTGELILAYLQLAPDVAIMQDGIGQTPLHMLCSVACSSDSYSGGIRAYLGCSEGMKAAFIKDEKGRTPLFYLLADNPYVTGEMITVYLQLAPDAAVMKDNTGMTPLHMLCSVSCSSESYGGAIRTYLGFSEGKRAAFMKDDDGRTPFQCLCEKSSFDKLSFLDDDKSFGGLTVWWYDCLGINLFRKHNNLNANRKRKISMQSTWRQNHGRNLPRINYSTSRTNKNKI